MKYIVVVVINNSSFYVHQIHTWFEGRPVLHFHSLVLKLLSSIWQQETNSLAQSLDGEVVELNVWHFLLKIESYFKISKTSPNTWLGGHEKKWQWEMRALWAKIYNLIYSWWKVCLKQILNLTPILFILIFYKISTLHSYLGALLGKFQHFIQFFINIRKICVDFIILITIISINNIMKII